MIKLFFILSILTTHPSIKDANMGVLICDYQTGDTIDAYRHNSVVPPASVMKLLTTATALERQGANYTMETPITYDGTIEAGVLHGNLYIEGKGDPTLGSRHMGNPNFLNNWVSKVQQAGIQKIEGAVIADVSYFDGDALNPSWLWEDAGNYYAPGIFALAYLDNTMRIELTSGPIGTIANVIKTVPEMPEVQFENHIRCTEITYDGAFVHGMPYTNKRYLVGSVPSNRQQFTIKGDLPNPGLLLAKNFVNSLISAGIEVTKGANYMTEQLREKDQKTQELLEPLPRTTLFTHHSPTLAEIIRHTNHASDNLYAEMLFRTLGARYSIPCTIRKSADFMREFWKNRGVSFRNGKILDGCGLAPQNAISPAMFVQLLRYMYGSKNKQAFLQSLPCSGESGTLKKFLKDTPLHGKVIAKSGTIGGTKNFAGYIFLPDGRVWVFAVMVSSVNMRTSKIQEVIEQYLLDVYQANT